MPDECAVFRVDTGDTTIEIRLRPGDTATVSLDDKPLFAISQGGVEIPPDADLSRWTPTYISPEVEARYVDEAEAGYDVSKLKPRRRPTP